MIDERVSTSRGTAEAAAKLGGLTLIVCAAVTLLVVQAAPGRADDAPAAPEAKVTPLTTRLIEQRYDNQVKPLLSKYCGDCHFDGADKGEVTLDRFASLASVQNDRVTWQKVADNVLTHSMPPAKRQTQPSDEERKAIVAWVREALEFCDCTGPRDPGRVTIRRLNREEYNNTIRDLLGVADFKPAADFPADDSGYGFDNNADVLTMSPLLVEKYLAAAEAALDKAIVTDPPPPTVVKLDGTELDGAGGRSGRRGERRTLATNGEAYATVQLPAGGAYEIRVKAAADQAGDEPARMALRVDDREVETFDVAATRRSYKDYEVELELEGGARRVAVAFVNDFWDETRPDGQRDRNLTIESVEVVGPLDGPPPAPSEAQRKLLFATSGDDAAAKVLGRFAARAYRRPVSAEEVARVVALYSGARADGESFEKAMKLAMSAVLVSPNFLFRIEREQSDDPAKPYFIGSDELAARLSYFLWSSMPDDALAAAAASGELRQTGVLQAEVKRMLADPKAQAFVRNFVGQWLVMRNLEHHSVSRERYAEFNERLRADMTREVELFFANVIAEDRSVLELLDSDYTFANGRLAKLYGLKDVEGDEFRRVSLAGTPRGGVTTMAGVLTVTAMPSRTSPVKRGKFVLDQLLASPVPPAPPTVMPLSDRRDEVKKGSVRQRFEAHRADATCVACHARMDPIGFAMENFDAIGRWRDTDAGFPIDASGKLPEGESFTGPAELRKVLVGRKDEFVRALVEKMMTYALGRGLQNSDGCTVREIADAVAKDGYRFSALVNGIVTSDAFQKRRAKRAVE